MAVHAKLKGGSVKTVKSFRVLVKIKNDAIKADKLLDGVCVFLTNHKETLGGALK